MAFSFQTTVASRGYHVFKNTTWEKARFGDKVVVEIETNEYSKKVDPYCCAIRTILHKSSGKLETVGHIPREVSRHCYYFIKDEGGRVDGSVLSTNYRPSPIPSGGLEIPLILTFRSVRFVTHKRMKEFMTKLYNYDHKQSDHAENSSDEEDEIHVDLGEVLEATDVESDSEVVQKKRKRKRVVIYSESDGEDESDHEGTTKAKIDVKSKNDEIDIMVEKCL